jgi:hypothetical protein
VEVTLVEEGTDRLVSLVEEGALHLAIGVLQKTERVRRLLLYPFCLLAIVSRGHRLARRRTLTVGDLATEPLLVFPRGYQTRRMIEEACAAARVEARVASRAGRLTRSQRSPLPVTGSASSPRSSASIGGTSASFPS